jgi:hypothetical protein
VINHNLTVALKWAGAGAHILVTAPDKKARIKWRDQSTTDADTIKSWFAEWPDSLPGIDLAKSGIVVIDGDRHGGADGVAAVEELFAEHKLNRSAIPTVLTPGNGIHCWFRQPDTGEPVGNSDKAVRDKGINVRGCGGYVIAPGTTLPDGRRYLRDEATPSTIEALSNGNIPVLPPTIVAVLRKPERAEPSPSQLKTNGHAHSPSTREEAYALATLEGLCAKLAGVAPNTGRNIELNNAALRLGHMVAAGWISRATVEGRLFGAATACGLLKDDGAHSIRATLKSGLDAGEKEPAIPLQDRAAPPAAAPVDERPKLEHNLNGHHAVKGTNTDDAPAGLAEWDFGEDTTIPPPREWLLGTTFCRTFLSSLIAAGGVGKTAVRYAQFLALTSGRNLTNEHVHRRSRVLVISLEDDDKELRRRMLAVMRHHNITHADIKGWLFVSAPGRSAGKLLEMDPVTRRTKIGELAANIEAAILRRKPDLVSLDPFVKAHSVEENGNSVIDEVAQILTELGAKYNVAVDTPHHVLKGTAEPGNADKGRGASAMVDAARLVKTLTPMSTKEAETFGVKEDDRKQFIRVDNGKVNITRGSGAAQWFELIGVQLENGTELYPGGDTIQVAKPWKPPEIWSDLSDATLNQILDKIEAGLPNNERYSAGGAAKGRAAWRVIADMVDKTEEQAKEMIRAWLKTGVLEQREYHSDNERKDFQGLWVSATKRPGTVYE